jgi:glycosyltransferase involved in cell wall biosynthesis
MPNIRGIKYISLAEPSGYGVAGRRCLLGLAQSGIPTTWTPMVPGAGGPLYYGPFNGAGLGDGELDQFCNRKIDYDVVIVHTVPEYFPFWIEAERGRTIIGHTVWETTAIPAHWPALLNSVDRLIVPCRWNKTVFAQCGVTVPIDVVPHIADDAAGSPGALTDRHDGDGYVFYTIGVWSHRKALYCTVKAFCEAFTADDPVTLLIKTNPRDLTVTGLLRHFRRSVAQAVRRVTRHYRRPPRIRLMTDVLSDSQIRRLHLRGDCYVSLCRGEGWGIGAFDAAAHGNPVVMTAFGGQLDYLNRDLAYLVNYELVPVINPQAPLSYSPDQRWAEPDIQHGAQQLRDVTAHPDEARARGRALQAEVLTRFGERTVIEVLISAIAGARRQRPISPSSPVRPTRVTKVGKYGEPGTGSRT